MRAGRLLAMAAVVALAMPAAVSAAPTTGDFVSGSGYRLGDGGDRRVQYRVDARNSGAGPTGTFTYRGIANGLTFSGRVTCLLVSGNRASVGGVVTRINLSDAEFGVGDLFVVVLADNGDPYRHQSGPDMVGFTDVYLADDPAYPGCTDPWAFDAWAPGFEGNITVKDG